MITSNEDGTSTEYVKDEFDLYEEAMERGVGRQLARARYGITPDAFDQLEEAFIFHYKTAWQVLKSGVKSVFLFRCHMCHRRHFGALEENTGNGGGLYCMYGIGYTFKSVWTHWWYAGKHGED